MRSSDEFKNEVYLRAKKEKQRIKRRNKALLTAIPCFAVIITLSLYGVYLGSTGTKSADFEEVAKDEIQTHEELYEDNLTQAVTEQAENFSEPQKGEDQMTQSAVQKPGAVKPDADDGFETILFLNQIFKLNPNDNIREQAAVVNSNEELAAFINANRDLGFSDEAIKSFKSFDDSFFSQSSLVIVTASFKGENPDDVTFQFKENSVDVNINAQRTDKKEDAKIVLIPIQDKKADSNIKVNVSFS